jgi:hypothetical protein
VDARLGAVVNGLLLATACGIVAYVLGWCLSWCIDRWQRWRSEV